MNLPEWDLSLMHGASRNNSKLQVVYFKIVKKNFYQGYNYIAKSEIVKITNL